MGGRCVAAAWSCSSLSDSSWVCPAAIGVGTRWRGKRWPGVRDRWLSSRAFAHRCCCERGRGGDPRTAVAGRASPYGGWHLRDTAAPPPEQEVDVTCGGNECPGG